MNCVNSYSRRQLDNIPTRGYVSFELTSIHTNATENLYPFSLYIHNEFSPYESMIMKTPQTERHYCQT